MEKITRLKYNYIPVMSDGKEVYSDDYKEVRIGEGNVIKITEHRAEGEGDKWFYDIVFNNNQTLRIFNPYEVYFETII